MQTDQAQSLIEIRDGTGPVLTATGGIAVENSSRGCFSRAAARARARRVGSETAPVRSGGPSGPPLRVVSWEGVSRGSVRTRPALLTAADTPAKDPPVGQTPDRHGRLRAVFDEALLQDAIHARGVRRSRVRERSGAQARGDAPAGGSPAGALVSRASAGSSIGRAAVRRARSPTPIAFASCDGLARAAWAWSMRCTTRSATKSSH